MPSPFDPFFARQGVVLLDGGLATELERRGASLVHPLWSASVLADDPEGLSAVHTAYLEAGADCIASASYQATVEGFVRSGFAEAAARALIVGSVEIACRARDAFWSHPATRAGRLRPLVAASIGPYGAYLADGSEYRGDYGLDRAQLVDFHDERWRMLAASAADLLAIETVPSAVEAEAIAELLDRTPDIWAWASFTCRDTEHLSDGTPLVEALAPLAEHPRIAALGVNCFPPDWVPDLINTLSRATQKPIAVYPNSGERWDAVEKRWLPGDGQIDLTKACVDWARRGARVLGGCCRTGPETIRAMRERLVG